MNVQSVQAIAKVTPESQISSIKTQSSVANQTPGVDVSQPNILQPEDES